MWCLAVWLPITFGVALITALSTVLLQLWLEDRRIDADYDGD